MTLLSQKISTRFIISALLLIATAMFAIRNFIDTTEWLSYAYWAQCFSTVYASAESVLQLIYFVLAIIIAIDGVTPKG